MLKINKYKITFIAILFCLAPLSANAVILGYITGNDYAKFDNNSRLNWLVGTMDGIMAEAIIIKKDSYGSWLGKCVNGLETSQIKAMFEKELNKNPESWHAPAALMFRAKMKKFCKGRM